MAFLIAAIRRPLAALAVLLGVSAGAAAQGGESGEHVVKAAFLYNFTKFVEWPESAFTGSSAPFSVCVLAEEPLRREISAAMRDEQVRGRRVEVSFPGPGDDLRTCHLAYFSHAEAERQAARLANVKQLPVLTVGEGPRFLKEGGMIAFLLVDNRVRFDISKRAADTAGLGVSSKLLRVARSVDGESAP